MCLECEVKRVKIKDKIVKRPSMDSEEILENIMDESVEIVPPITNGEPVEIVPCLADEESVEVLPVETTKRAEFQGASPRSVGSLLYFVQAIFVNVRSGPGTGFGVTGSLNQGQVIAFQPSSGLDRSPTTWNDGWGWVRYANSNNWVAGWSGTSFSNSFNGHLLPVHQRTFQAQITGQVNFRIGPGTEFQTGQIGNFLSLPAGARINVNYFVARNSLPWSFTIPARDLTQVWLGFRSIVAPDGTLSSGQGWVRADLVGGVPADLIQPRGPFMGGISTFPRTAVVTSPALNRRAGAGTHTPIVGQYQMGQMLNITHSQRNLTEDRTWLNTVSNSWIAGENTTTVERVSNRIFRVNVPQANIRNAPDVSGTTIIGTQPSNMRLRITHRRRVIGGMDWFRFDQVVGGINTVGWIADVNGFVEGEVGSPGIMMPPNAEHPDPWIDSRPVSLRNPDYIAGHITGTHRPFYSTRNLNEITQIVIHHTASATSLTRLDIEVGWRGLGWWNGGYHEMIRADGTVEVCYNADVVTNGAYGQNRFSYHISLVGDFRVSGVQPTTAQMNALTRRVRHWQTRLGVATNHVVGHSERVPTICPGMNINDFRSRLGGNVQPPLPTTSDRERIEQTLQDLPREIANVLGFGMRPETVNFLPNMTNVIQKSEFLILPNFRGRFTFQEVLGTSSPFGFNIRNGQVESNSAVETAWNIATQFIPELSANLLNLNEFTRRLGSIVQNGSAILTIEPGVPFPWLTLKIAAEHSLPSGNKFKFELKFQISPIWRQDDNLSLESVPVDIRQEVEVTERRARRDAEGWAQTHLEQETITFIGFLIIMGLIALAILKFPISILGAASLAVARSDLQRELNDIFSSRGLHSEIRL